MYLVNEHEMTVRFEFQTLIFVERQKSQKQTDPWICLFDQGQNASKTVLIGALICFLAPDISHHLALFSM